MSVETRPGGCVRLGNLCRRFFCSCLCNFRGPLGVKAFFFGSRLNIFALICGPLAFVSESRHWPEGATFVLAMLAIMPLAERLGYLTEQLAMHTNDTLGGLLNATFGNAVETLISIVALDKAKKASLENRSKDVEFFMALITTSLMGSMLSNLLLVQGSAFFVGGLRHPVQTFSKEGAVTSAGLLVLAVLALSVPTMLWQSQDEVHKADDLGLSRFVALCLLSLYLCFLLFQLKTHRFLFEKAAGFHLAKVEADRELEDDYSVTGPGNAGVVVPPGQARRDLVLPPADLPTARSKTNDVAPNDDLVLRDLEEELASSGIPTGSSSPPASTIATDIEMIAHPRVNTAASVISESAGLFRPRNRSMDTDIVSVGPALGQSDRHPPDMGLYPALLWLTLSTVAVAFVSHVVVEAAQGAVESFGINELFIGGIVVPIVGNAAEHASALMFAWRDKMDIALAVAVGSAVQIPLFVMPLCVLVAWGQNLPLSLNLNPFMMSVVVVTSLAVAFTLHAGSSHWLHGLILIVEYAIIAAAFYFHG